MKYPFLDGVQKMEVCMAWMATIMFHCSQLFNSIYSIPCLQKAGKGVSVLPSCSVKTSSLRPTFG